MIGVTSMPFPWGPGMGSTMRSTSNASSETRNWPFRGVIAERGVADQARNLVGAQAGRVDDLLGLDRRPVVESDGDCVGRQPEADHGSTQAQLGSARDRRVRVRAREPEGVEDAFAGDRKRSSHIVSEIRRNVTDGSPIQQLGGNAEDGRIRRDLGRQSARFVGGVSQHQGPQRQEGDIQLFERRRPQRGCSSQHRRLDRARLRVEARMEDGTVGLRGALAEVRLRLEQDAGNATSRELTQDRASDDAAPDDDHSGMLGRHHLRILLGQWRDCIDQSSSVNARGDDILWRRCRMRIGCPVHCRERHEGPEVGH